MFHKLLPPSLVSKGQRKAIIDSLIDIQLDSGSRLSLAIPLTELMAYYESELISALVATHIGIVYLSRWLHRNLFLTPLKLILSLCLTLRLRRL